MKYLVIILSLFIICIFSLAATKHESGTFVRKMEMQYHNAASTSGVSSFTLDDNTYTNTALVQAIGGDIRWGYANTFLSGNTVTPSFGFILREDNYLELISRDQVDNFRWIPDLDSASTGATVYCVQEG